MVSLLGLIPWSPLVWLRILLAWRRCGGSFAFLAEVAALRFSAQVALWDEDGPLTFAELWREAEGLAGWWRHQGIGPGQQVGLMCRNHRSFVLGLLALSRLGADVTPLACDLPPAVWQRYRLDGMVREEDCAGRSWGELPRVRAGQLVVLTSGTTGVAKGVRRRPGLLQVLPIAAGLLGGLPLRRGRPLILAIPLYHGYGLACLALMIGFTVLTVSAFIPLVYFGALLSLSMLSGMLGTLVMLPLLLQWTTSSAPVKLTTSEETV